MFCHVCGAKLIDGARFCSKCGTAIPAALWENDEAAPASEPVSEPKGIALAPEPEPEEKKTKQEPEPAFEPERMERKSAPAPNPLELHITVTQQQIDRNETIVLQDAALAEPLTLRLSPPMRDGSKMRLKNAYLADGSDRPVVLRLCVETSAPAPQTESAPETTAVPESQPEIAPQPKAPPEPLVLTVSVRQGQIDRGESVLLDDAELLTPISLRLSPNMHDGSRMRLQNANARPADDGRKRDVIVRIHVLQPEPVPEAPTPEAEPVPGEKPEPAPTRTAEKPTAAPAAPVVLYKSARIGFRLVEPGEKVDGYRFGGDDNGFMQLRSDGMTLYKKSKLKRMAFGVIGSIIEGEGKEYATIGIEEIASYEANIGRLPEYRFVLKDGRRLRLYYIGEHKKLFSEVMERFLQLIPSK